MLEFWNTIAAIGTFVVIAATAIAAVVQLRHLRATNQLEGLLSVLARVEDARFNTWLTETQQLLPSMLVDAPYLQSVVDGTFDRSVAWLQLGNSYDWVGSLVKNRLIPIDAFLDVYSFRVRQAWKLMEPLVVLVRRHAYAAVWENFEFLYVRASEWIEKHPEGNYPRNVPHAQLPPYDELYPRQMDLGSKKP